MNMNQSIAERFSRISFFFKCINVLGILLVRRDLLWGIYFFKQKIIPKLKKEMYY
jgi:hypothetical protein